MKNSEKNMENRVFKDIFPKKAWELISTGEEKDLGIIDVSTPKEYENLHLEGAINVSLFSRFFKARLEVMDKDKTYLVYCKIGGRSKIAQRFMKQQGFQGVYNIIGGTLLWEEEGLPFAMGTKGVNKFSFCPFFISFLIYKKIKKGLNHVFSNITPKRIKAASPGEKS